METQEEQPAAEPAAQPTLRAVPRLEPTELFFNRELSWLRFNDRVLNEALDAGLPLLERVKFLSIFASNLDEFFMVRVSGLERQLAAGVVEAPPDGMSPAQQLAAIRERLMPALERAGACWQNDLLPQLRGAGITVTPYAELGKKACRLLKQHFEREIFPVLTPLAFDPGHPFPHISNLSMNLAVVVRDPERGERFARLKVPPRLPRLVRVPRKKAGKQPPGLADSEVELVWLEELIAANLGRLFPGLEIVAVHPFRVTRDADQEIEEDEAADLLTAMAEVVESRHFGSAVRLEVAEAMPKEIRKILMKNLGLERYQVYTADTGIGLAALAELSQLDRPELKDPVFLPVVLPRLANESEPFPALRGDSVVLYHPYDSFAPIVQLIQEAARDPQVVAIKQTLYRIGPDSPIVDALIEARENGKQVAVLMELKARFDEENNIGWARRLEREGVHVVYGLLGLKVHAKMLLIVRRERGGVRRYVHLGTGNYNQATARAYSDIGYLSCDPSLGEDVSDLFNALTGYSAQTQYRKLLVAPGKMRAQLLERIEREIEVQGAGGDGYLAFKLNSLADAETINALYRASQAGVRVDLQVRGICCLRPELPGVSDNIRVTSVVGRFLEHARLYYFRNGGDEELLVGSADLMARNLDKRVETLFPIDEPHLLAALRDDVLFLHLRDNRKCWRLCSDGSYVRVEPAEGEEEIDSQARLLAAGGRWRGAE